MKNKNLSFQAKIDTFNCGKMIDKNEKSKYNDSVVWFTGGIILSSREKWRML